MGCAPGGVPGGAPGGGAYTGCAAGAPGGAAGAPGTPAGPPGCGAGAGGGGCARALPEASARIEATRKTERQIMTAAYRYLVQASSETSFFRIQPGPLAVAPAGR